MSSSHHDHTPRITENILVQANIIPCQLAIFYQPPLTNQVKKKIPRVVVEELFLVKIAVIRFNKGWKMLRKRRKRILKEKKTKKGKKEKKKQLLEEKLQKRKSKKAVKFATKRDKPNKPTEESSKNDDLVVLVVQELYPKENKRKCLQVNQTDDRCFTLSFFEKHQY